MKSDAIQCDIFCAVIDNFGDAAVSWRLARQLADEHGWKVRLLIDRPDVLERLTPDREVPGVEIRHWTAATIPGAIPDVVVEAFACDLPGAYLSAMAASNPAPLWLNLEYLSAELWIDDCHGLPSRHPRLPLTKHFFFPGFTPASGGLLREADYDTRRARFDPALFRRTFDLPPPPEDGLTISMFSYPTPLLEELLAAWAASASPVQVLFPGASLAARQTGALELHPLPFLPQRQYDELLWTCDINFVRGEDSFVRAQWAARPFVWHIYPQHEAAHEAKLDAFLARYPGAKHCAPLWQAWNRTGTGESLTEGWARFAGHVRALGDAARSWERSLAAGPELATKLVRFCTDRIE